MFHPSRQFISTSSILLHGIRGTWRVQGQNLQRNFGGYRKPCEDSWSQVCSCRSSKGDVLDTKKHLPRQNFRVKCIWKLSMLIDLLSCTHMHQKKIAHDSPGFQPSSCWWRADRNPGGFRLKVYRYISFIKISQCFFPFPIFSPCFFSVLTPRKAPRMDCNASVVSPRQTPKLKTPHGPLAPSRRSRPKSCETHHWNDHHRVALQWYQQSHVSNPQFFGRDLISFHQKVGQILKSCMGFNEDL